MPSSTPPSHLVRQSVKRDGVVFPVKRMHHVHHDGELDQAQAALLAIVARLFFEDRLHVGEHMQELTPPAHGRTQKWAGAPGACLQAGFPWACLWHDGHGRAQKGRHTWRALAGLHGRVWGMRAPAWCLHGGRISFHAGACIEAGICLHGS
eukprot:359992-Chlamydomonas_euryale.AAC.2